jgi:hypothetical protein
MNACSDADARRRCGSGDNKGGERASEKRGHCSDDQADGGRSESRKSPDLRPSALARPRQINFYTPEGHNFEPKSAPIRNKELAVLT